MTDGGLAISSGVVVGTNGGANSGDIWTGTSFGSDQYSSIEVTSTPLSGGQWIGPAVRAQDGGQSLYVGIYWWDQGTPELMLFERSDGGWSQLGNTYDSGVLAAGTELELTAVGSTLAFSENGVTEITATSSSLTGGAPGIIAFDTPTAGDWTGGDVVGTLSIGGVVTGSSGTVVLENNGGDALSVSNNGPFTFDSLLASGASYDVTVATSPPGQFCNVSNGTGSVATSDVSDVSVACTTESFGTISPGAASDDFARPSGSLGANWTDMSDGGLAISSGAVVGTNAGSTSGDIWTGSSFDSDQYSSIEVSSTPLTGDEWIGPAVRAQDDGQSLYVGFYYWNDGQPELMLFERSAGSWFELASASTDGALAPGTQLELTAVGSTLALKENGVVTISASSATYGGSPGLTGGAPGIIANGAATAGDWTGGNAGFEVDYLGTDASGIESYDMISANNGYGPQVLRVLRPTDPAPGVAHNFLYVLPVEAGLGDEYGDGLATLQALNAQNQYNLTIIEPSFYIDPWYANNPDDVNLQYETFMTTELEPWVSANLATTGTEQNWLIGFSKSGYGAQDLILKYPNLFTLAASWDFPADMSSYDALGDRPRRQLRDRGEFRRQLSADQRLPGRPQDAFPDREPDLDRGLQPVWKRRLRLRRSFDIGRDRVHNRGLGVSRSQLG